jgi:hypothetical protein
MMPGHQGMPGQDLMPGQRQRVYSMDGFLFYTRCSQLSYLLLSLLDCSLEY